MRDTLVTERIESNLTRLRLARIRQILEQVVESAQKESKSYLRFLDELLEEEVASKRAAPGADRTEDLRSALCQIHRRI